MKNDNNILTLNGSDWEAQYFLSEEQFSTWSGRSRNLENMLLDSSRSAGFVSGAEAPDALKGTVPGCDRTFLLENHQMEEPYYGRNLERSSWSEKAAWSFRKWFTVPKQWIGRRVRIDFAGIDYEAMFFLNDVYLGTHQGAFVPCGWDITEWVKFGEKNLIAVSFLPAPREPLITRITPRPTLQNITALNLASAGTGRENWFRRASGMTSLFPPMKRFVSRTGIPHFQGMLSLYLWQSNPALRKGGCHWKWRCFLPKDKVMR